MAWGPEKCAGFALAALVADDRSLTAVADALTSEQREHLVAQLPQGARDQVAPQIARLLRELKPLLDERALALPVRMRRLVANHATPALRAQLLMDGAPTRDGFSADEGLAAALLRIARRTASWRPR